MKKTFILSFYMILLLWVLLNAGTSNVVFLNTGRMTVDPGGKIYVSGAMRHLSTSNADSVKVVQNGITDIAGNLYQDAKTRVFDVPASSTTTSSTGIVRFVSNNGSKAKRYITTFTADSLNCSSFDRSLYYVAFPNVVIDTNDSLVIPARMGIDALSIHTGTTNTGGKMILRSDQLDGADYDASLRVTGSGSSASVVDVGLVVVEREVGLYRTVQSLFPFASPFKNTQMAGYFAGNWIRHPLADGTYGSTTYIYGNKDLAPKDGYIDIDQYVIYPNTTLAAAEPYLVKPRPAGFDYSSLTSGGGLSITGSDPSLYDKGKFYFNGSVYSMTPYSEQLFADDNLVSKSIAGIPSSTVNWVIGNSYTCPISTAELVKALNAASGITFSTAYVYVAGSQSYQPFTSGGNPAIVVSGYSEIPAMSIFLLTLPNATMQNGSISLGKGLQRHGKFSHGAPSSVRSQSGVSPSAVENQINFRMSPEDNSNVYDLAAIGLRNDAAKGVDKYDVDKIYNSDSQCFQLYTISGENRKLSANGMPTDIDYVTMAVKPTAESKTYKITATNVETLSSEGAWLKDMQTDSVVDLATQPIYTFTAGKGDSTERFRVYFVKPVSTKVSEDKPLVYGVFTGNHLLLDHLDETDLNTGVSVFDTYGRELVKCRVTSYPRMSIGGTFPAGVYIVKIMGGSGKKAMRVIKPDNN